MTSPLATIPIPKRRRLAATIGLFATLFCAVGAVALAGPDDVVIYTFAGIAFLLAAILGLAVWGVVTSMRKDLREQQLDRAIEEVVGAHGMTTCGCGHEHDPSELHIVGDENRQSVDEDPACAHDGAGESCAHDCQTCVVTALRTEPARRPRPTPAG